MSPSDTAKKYGCESLNQVSRVTGQSIQTLINWHKNKPELFKTVCKGVSDINSRGDKDA